MHQRNAEIARRMWDATSRGDADDLRDLLSPGVRWNAPGAGALSGLYRGPDEVVDLLARVGEHVDGLCSDLIDVFASDRGAILRYRMRAQRGLQSLETEILLRLSIEHGRLTEIESVATDPAGERAFWRAH